MSFDTNGVSGKYNQYTYNLSSAVYYYKSTDGEFDLGIGQIIVSDTSEKEIALVRANFYTTNTAFAAEGDWTISGFADVTDNTPYSPGASYINSGKLTSSALLIAGHQYSGVRSI